MKNKYIILIIITIYTLYYIASILNYKIDTSVRNLCNNIYLHGENKKYSIIKSLFSKTECLTIIQRAEDYGNKYGWKKTRHQNYPTNDNRLTRKWDIYSMIKNKIINKVYNELESLFKINKSKLGINEIFIVKYSETGQRSLEYHKDGSEFSFIICLNKDFTGGGTEFENPNKIINLNIGDCLVFCGQNRHKGRYINSGTRYILTGFLNFGGMETCHEYMKFIN